MALTDIISTSISIVDWVSVHTICDTVGFNMFEQVAYYLLVM